MTDLLHQFAAFCGPAGIGPVLRAGLLPGLLLAGAAGSIMHCGPMCGPFVLGQVSDRMARVPAAHLCELHRLRAAALLPYHLGRLSTYAALGAAVGFAGGAITRLPYFGALSGILLLLAAASFLAHALRGRGYSFATRAGWLTAGLRRWRPRSGFLLGVSLGFLPCGFLYGALTAAAASGSALLGAAAMTAFGLGTVPTLVLIGVLGHAAGRAWQHGVARATPLVLAANAIVLGVMGVAALFTASA